MPANSQSIMQESSQSIMQNVNLLLSRPNDEWTHSIFYACSLKLEHTGIVINGHANADRLIPPTGGL